MIGRLTLIEEEQMYITGQVIIMDMKGIKYTHYILILYSFDGTYTFVCLLNTMAGYSLDHFAQLLSKSTKMISIQEVFMVFNIPHAN